MSQAVTFKEERWVIAGEIERRPFGRSEAPVHFIDQTNYFFTGPRKTNVLDDLLRCLSREIFLSSVEFLEPPIYDRPIYLHSLAHLLDLRSYVSNRVPEGLRPQREPSFSCVGNPM